MKSFKFIILALFVNVMAAHLAFAQEYNEQGVRIGENEFQGVGGKQIGPLDVKASVSEVQQFDSNVFWTQDTPKSDWINVTSPQVLLSLPVGSDERDIVQAMYHADINTFDKYTSQNSVNQYAAGNADFRLPFGYFNLQDDFDHTSDRASTEFTSRVTHTDNTASTKVGVELNKLDFETGFSDYVRTYDLPSYEVPYGYDEREVSETGFYQLFPKTKALIEYDHDFINYYKTASRDGYFDQVLVGLKGDVTGKTQVLVKFGYQNRNYNALGQDGYSGFVAQAGTITQFTEDTKLSLTYVDTAEESTYSNDNYYNMNYFKADLNQKLIGRLSVDLSSDVSRNLYPEVDPTLFQKRHDTIVDEGLALKYDIQDWVDAKIGYTFREQMTNIATYSYLDNLWSIGLDLKY